MAVSQSFEKVQGALLHCPIRGLLTVSERAADGLTYTEEKRRIDCIRFLLAKGYPPSHFKIETVLLRFGNKGRNSFRTDLAVLDAPVSTLPNDVVSLRPHIKLVAEIKRDNADAATAKRTQVYPAMDFLQDISAYGVYWDDVEQRLYYRTLHGTRTTPHEAPIAVLPRWGQALESRRLKVADLRPTTDLRGIFEKIEDRLHSEIADKSRRFEIMLQLLLVKLFDEHTHGQPSQEVDLQDFTDAPLGDTDVLQQYEAILRKAVTYYGRYLPNPVSPSIGVSGARLREISSLLAPIRILGSKRDVIQDFYMYFAQGVYKWDLAQYFTPTEVVDFIVTLVNPLAGDVVKDPACGSADFLISALQYARQSGADLRDAIWGADNSENAVQVSVLNMVLNGDGKSHIKNEDSLTNVGRELNAFTVLLCNPPFGVKIKDRRFNVLSQFDLGHEWTMVDGSLQRSDKVLESQEVGLLFAELCVKQAVPGGRVGIILPNGYLGNRSQRYIAFREWLLRNTRVVAVVGFPRFTFKKSGADVSASVVVLEKRQTPLVSARDSEHYPFHAGILESVGWSVSDKRAERIFQRDPETGVFLTDANNEPIPDADFDRVVDDFRASPVADVFPWVARDVSTSKVPGSGWSVSISEVLARSDLSIDTKRWCERAVTVRREIAAMPHFALRDAVEAVPEAGVPQDKRALYNYVEIQDVMDGTGIPRALRGWELPDRARHRAEHGEIFVGRIWGSVGKWFVAGGNCTAMVVSNGFHRLRLKPSKEDYLVDILAALNTEAYRIQARSCATGSDGLADVSEDDLLDIMLPKVTDLAARETLQPIADALLTGRSTISSVVSQLIHDGQVPSVQVVPRSTLWVQV